MGCDYYYGYNLCILYADGEEKTIEISRERGYYYIYDCELLDDISEDKLKDLEIENMYKRHPDKDIYKDGKWLIANEEVIKEYTEIAKREHDVNFNYIKRSFYIYYRN